MSQLRLTTVNKRIYDDDDGVKLVLGVIFLENSNILDLLFHLTVFFSVHYLFKNNFVKVINGCHVADFTDEEW